MSKSIILIHGRDFKPPRESLKQLWFDALAHGLTRDFGEDKLVMKRFHDSDLQFVYYGDVSNKFLEAAKKEKCVDDTAQRRRSLDNLMEYKAIDFRKKKTYNKLPGKSMWPEFFADSLGTVVSLFRLGEEVISIKAPDMTEYFKQDESSFGSAVRQTLVQPLCEAMDKKHEICVIAHSLGTLISYDTFWKFSRMGEYRGVLGKNYSQNRIGLWITLGSPLGDLTCQRHLKGSMVNGDRRYPNNIDRWINIAAEDDVISHDSTVSDDYRAMTKYSGTKISDKKIYNLGLSFYKHPKGSSNPHSELGYLIHPAVTGAVAEWLIK